MLNVKASRACHAIIARSAIVNAKSENGLYILGAADQSEANGLFYKSFYYSHRHVPK